MPTSRAGGRSVIYCWDIAWVHSTDVDPLQRDDAKIPPQSDIDASTQEFLTKTQVLLAPLLPSRAPQGIRPTKKADKASSLLLFGTPGVEQGFEPALELVKTPPRFGLLLVGGAALR